MHRPLRVIGLLTILLVTACATTPAFTETYDDIGQAMEADIEPFADTLLPQELTKDPEAVDYAAIEAAARQATSIFEQMRSTGRNLYEPSPKIRAHAETAAIYFSEIANAAAAKQHGALVRLSIQKKSICANCHG